MKIRYFLMNATGQLVKVSQASVYGLWNGSRRARGANGALAQELRLVSIICDENLLPLKIYVVRLPLCEGVFTEESQLTLKIFASPDCVTPDELVQHHTEGWPADFFRQLAVALDVPLDALKVPLGVGGPLFTAAVMCVSPQQAVRYLR